MVSPPDNRNVPPSDYTQLVSSVPSHVVNSWDWHSRRSWRPELWKRRLPRGLSFTKAIEQRLNAVDLHPDLPYHQFDLGTARRPCEIAYSEKLAVLSDSFIGTCSRVDGRLFHPTSSFSKKQGSPRNDLREPDILSPADRKWERQMRNRTGYFLPCSQKETFYFNKRGLASTCVPAPEWFARYEIHYGLHIETPPVVAYRGSALMEAPDQVWWETFLTEWAALTSYELLYQARQGRLHFIPGNLRASIRDLCCDVITHCDEDLTDRLHGIMREIELIRWSEITPKNRSLPDYACRTPVSIIGHWVAFNAEAWESQMSDDMHFEEGEAGLAAYVPDFPRGVLIGHIDRRAELERITRPAEVGEETHVPTHYRLLKLVASQEGETGSARANPAPRDEQLLNPRNETRVVKIFNKVLDQAGLTQHLAEHGYPNGLSLDDAAKLIRESLIKMETTRMLADRPEAVVAGPSRTIGEELDAMEITAQEAKAEPTEVKEEPLESNRPTKRPPRELTITPVSGSTSKPSASVKRMIDDDVINLVSSEETAGGEPAPLTADPATQ